MKVLTFVVPAYNSEQFLDKGIPSMLHPKILNKLEIIIVNDGSTDATARIAEQYCARYPDSVRLISQPNKGHGGALNTGCAAATGKYLKVIDADDWVIMENLPQFLERLETCNADVVLTHYHTVDIRNGHIRQWMCAPDQFGQCLSFDKIMGNWRAFKWGFTLHGITYRTAFYQQAGNILPEHVFYEDYCYAAFPCCLAESVMALDLFLYEYRIGDVNQSVSSANQLRRIGHTEAVLRDMLEKYQALPGNPGKAYAAAKIGELFLSYLTTVLLLNPNKAEGRKLAAQEQEFLSAAAPEIFASVRKKYQVLSLANRLHISKKTWDALMRARTYNPFPRNHPQD